MNKADNIRSYWGLKDSWQGDCAVRQIPLLWINRYQWPGSLVSRNSCYTLTIGNNCLNNWVKTISISIGHQILHTSHSVFISQFTAKILKIWWKSMNRLRLWSSKNLKGLKMLQVFPLQQLSDGNQNVRKWRACCANIWRFGKHPCTGLSSGAVKLLKG